MATILFYSPFYRRSRDVESVMFFLKAQGHTVISLSQSEGTEINPFLNERGIRACSYFIKGDSNLWYFIRHALYLISFCRKNKVTVVFSHLNPANFVASVSQYFIKASVFLFRHHIDEAALYNYHRSWSYLFTNKLAKKIIVVSQRSLEYTVEVERVPKEKVMHINLSYDFSLYKIPGTSTVEEIRTNYGGTVLLVTVCRLTKFKRPELSIDVLNRVRKSGVDARLIILGTGEMQTELEEKIRNDNLKDFIFLPGHLSNALDFITAADYILHPSVLESSCVVIKEAGLVKRPVIVCKDIGDFNEYIINKRNGFLVDKDCFVDQASEVIVNSINENAELQQMGNHLSEAIKELFDIAKVGKQYYPLIDES